MTKNKRFNFNLTVGEDEHKGLIFCDGQIMKTIDVVYLLNKLLNEKDKSIKILTNHNKEYLHSINILEDKLKKLKELEKENEWLKKSIKRQQSSNEECSKYIEEVVKENEQLKSTNMEMEDYLGRLEEELEEERRKK